MNTSKAVKVFLASLVCSLVSCGPDTRNYIKFPTPFTVTEISSVGLMIVDHLDGTSDELVITDEKYIAECIDSLPGINPNTTRMRDYESGRDVNVIFYSSNNEPVFRFNYYEYHHGGTNLVEFGTKEPYEIHETATNVFAFYFDIVETIKDGKTNVQS